MSSFYPFEHSYEIVLKWMHNEYMPQQIAKSIKYAGEDRILKEANALIELGHIIFYTIEDEQGKVIEEFAQKLSPFITYHWEGSFTLRRSFINSLSAYYNTGFTLLRCALDMLFQGLFFQCLSQKSFRERGLNQKVQKFKEVVKLVNQLNNYLKRNNEEIEELEKDPIHIFNIIEKIIHEPRPECRGMYIQLAKWGLFYPYDEPINMLATLYRKLAYNAHENIGTTDISRAVKEGKEIFDFPNPILPKSLNEFLEDYHKVIDIWTVGTLNILRVMLPEDYVKRKFQKLQKHSLFEAAQLNGEKFFFQKYLKI
jgi:hypothetical protein